MTNKINGIDVSECPCKDDDKCLEVPILNEYGDLIDYQDCEPQTLCPYRLKTKIQRLQEENEKLYKALEEIRKEANRLLYEENPIYGYNNSNYFEILAKYVLAKTKEVLNDRD